MSTDRQQPLDAEEAELAAIYRRLPAASPDAELDAHILAQSRAAIVRDRRRMPAALRWTLGSAAAAVVTVGLAWQIGQLGRGPQWSRPAPAAPRMSAPAESAAAPADRVELEYLRREKPAAAIAELHEAIPPSDPQAGAETRLRTQRAPAVSAPPPAEGQMAAPAPPPPPPPAPAPAVSREAEPRAALDRVEVTGSRITAEDLQAADAEATEVDAAEATLPPLRNDYRLTPPRWLDRIRERAEAGDRDGATRSLRRFVRDYPYLVVPEDLAVLLRE